MDWSTSDVIATLTFLLPGFISAWILYALTSFPRPGEFERVVQALIFTVVIQVAVLGVQHSAYMIGSRWAAWGPWTKDTAVLWSLIVAVVFGLFATYCTNNDLIHRYLRKFQITLEMSYPSEWYGSFSQNPVFVVLHLTGGRRIYGWPVEWPSAPHKGHFSLELAEWLVEENGQNKRVELTGVRNILIPATEVEMVEFMTKQVRSEENGRTKDTNAPAKPNTD